jgi:hypothetical protein
LSRLICLKSVRDDLPLCKVLALPNQFETIVAYEVALDVVQNGVCAKESSILEFVRPTDIHNLRLANPHMRGSRALTAPTLGDSKFVTDAHSWIARTGVGDVQSAERRLGAGLP